MQFKSVYRSKILRSAAAFALLCTMLMPAASSALAEGGEDTSNLTNQSTVTLPERSAAFEPRLTDGRYNSRISFQPQEALELTLADGAKGLYIAWYTAPEAAMVEMLDASGTVLSSLAASPDLLNEYVTLPEGCARMRISGEKAFAVSELGVYASETAPDSLCIMTEQKQQPKVMVILAQTMDESFYFGSLLPYLSGDDAALVFLSSENRQAQQEAIAARYALGSRTQPVFGSFSYYPTTLDLKRLYTYVDKNDATNWLVALIRRYQPETLITHAVAPEGGIGMHELTAKHVLIAADQAADAKKEYVSERAFGVWQVRAVYQHAESGSAPLYDTQSPLSVFGGESAASLAQAAYECYSSPRVLRATVTDTPYFVQTYPMEVSQEQSTSELMALLLSLKVPAALPFAAATPVPSESPVPEPTQAPAGEPTQEQAPAAGDASPAKSELSLYLGAGLALLGLVSIVLSIVAGKRAQAEKKRGLVFAGVAIGLVLLFAGAGMLYRVITAKPAAETQPETTPLPSASIAPAASESPEPAAEAQAGDTEKSDAFASHFRKEGDPEEVIVFDDENGIYQYRSDTLAIEIVRVVENAPPLAYYVAHIYERDIDSYRSGFGSARLNGRDTADACAMARRYRAVLGMTGDNLMHSDYNRGMMLRDGRAFRSQTQVSMMALTEDFSMRIYNAKDTTMLNEIEEGTQDTFAFGPPLILNSVLCEKVDEDRVGRINPRAGLGLVEPGHFVAIVVDGRLPHYSHGMMLSDFAKLFQNEGCVMAYNLDGGASATLVFMGEYINKRASNHYRSVPDQLLWGYSEQVPTEDEPYRIQGLVPQDWRMGDG